MGGGPGSQLRIENRQPTNGVAPFYPPRENTGSGNDQLPPRHLGDQGLLGTSSLPWFECLRHRALRTSQFSRAVDSVSQRAHVPIPSPSNTNTPQPPQPPTSPPRRAHVLPPQAQGSSSTRPSRVTQPPPACSRWPAASSPSAPPPDRGSPPLPSLPTSPAAPRAAPVGTPAPRPKPTCPAP